MAPRMPSPDSTPSESGRAGVVVLAVWTLGVTLARTIRWPNDFAEAHWLLDYRFGFVKRGLAGQMLTSSLAPLGLEPTEAIIAAVSAVLFALFCVVVLAVAWRLVVAGRRSPASVLVALALLSSPFVVMSAHLVGYFDNLLLMLTVGAVVLAGRRRLLAASVVLSLAVLIHESAIVLGYPVLVLAWWVSGRATLGPGQRPAPWPLLLPVVTFAGLAASAMLLPVDFQDRYSRYLGQFAFVAGDMHLFVPEWLTPGFLEQLAPHNFARRIAFAEMYGLVVPTTLALLAWTVDAFEVRSRSVTMGLLLVVVLAPQVLHLAAWDTTRIWTYSIATAMLAAWVVARSSAPAAPVTTSVRWIAAVAIVVNVMAMTPLLDNLVDRYALTTRLLMYAPVLGATAWLVTRDERPDPARSSD